MSFSPVNASTALSSIAGSQAAAKLAAASTSSSSSSPSASAVLAQCCPLPLQRRRSLSPLPYVSPAATAAAPVQQPEPAALLNPCSNLPPARSPGIVQVGPLRV